MLGWKAKSNCASVFTAGSLDELHGGLQAAVVAQRDLRAGSGSAAPPCPWSARGTAGTNPQCVAKRRNSAFRTSSPPPVRSSDSTTARIWSNSSSAGTPPKRANALSSPSVSTAMVCRG